jgi:hypothetical protein
MGYFLYVDRLDELLTFLGEIMNAVIEGLSKAVDAVIHVSMNEFKSLYELAMDVQRLEKIGRKLIDIYKKMKEIYVSLTDFAHRVHALYPDLVELFNLVVSHPELV